MGVAFADYDNDGFTDIFVSNDTFQNFLLHNNGDGTFTDVASEAGVAFTGNGKTVAGMGADFRDLDNDGKPDIFHTAMFGDTFPLYRNLGGGQFEDATSRAGLTTLTSRFTAWEPAPSTSITMVERICLRPLPTFSTMRTRLYTGPMCFQISCSATRAI